MVARAGDFRRPATDAGVRHVPADAVATNAVDIPTGMADADRGVENLRLASYATRLESDIQRTHVGHLPSGAYRLKGVSAVYTFFVYV